MLTDSGGFQVFSLSKLRKVTEEGVQFRSHLDGSAHFSRRNTPWMCRLHWEPTSPWPSTSVPSIRRTGLAQENSLRLTMAWARRSLDQFRAHRHEVPWHEEFGGQTQNLFGIVQGGMYRDLRRESAERLVEMDFDGYAIGGLSVGEPREPDDGNDCRSAAPVPKDKPRYVMGSGTRMRLNSTRALV